MLFGSEEIQKRLISEVKKFEQERNIKVVYGALVGSISKGIQFADSDYDTRFLYINKNFPNQIINPEKAEEEKVIYRKYLSNTCFEKIPFWELGAFMQYLVSPVIDGRFSTGLYNVVSWTFLSPYMWDPYGLQNKIVPIMQKLFYKNYYIHYHQQNILDESINGDLVNVKEYLTRLHSALTINWADQYDEFPPVYIWSLLQIVPEEIRCEVQEFIYGSRKLFKEKVGENRSAYFLHEESDMLMMMRSEIIDGFVEKIKGGVTKMQLDYLTDEKRSKFIKDIGGIYELVRRSLFCEEPIMEKL